MQTVGAGVSYARYFPRMGIFFRMAAAMVEMANASNASTGVHQMGSKVRAFRVPRGVMVECFATTLHYAPCHTDPKKGFKVLVALPLGTNTDKPEIIERTPEDKLLFARNKWLIAHEESPEYKRDGALLGITGKNLVIKY